MNPSLILVIVMWGGVIGTIIACLIPEFKKTPEQRKAEAELIRESLYKNREEAKKKMEEVKRQREEERKNAPAKGCLESAIELGLMWVILMIVVIFCIMLLISTGI